MAKILTKFLFFVLVLALVTPVIAQATKTLPTPTTKKEKVEYVLPYPGILPDHPLYALKRLRDLILDKLIVDPVRKIDFYVLQADKRLNMGIALKAKNKPAMAEEAISKGEKYMHKAVGGFTALKRDGKEVPGYISDRLEKSMAKHIEVLEELISPTAGSERAGLEGSLELVKAVQQEFIKIK